MDIKSLSLKISDCIEQSREMIIATGEDIFNNPETGYKEFKTAEYMVNRFRELGFECMTPGDIPAVKVTLDTGRPGPSVAILGELDSIICTEHARSDKKTGAVHACGHNAQLAALIGACAGIVNSDAAKYLSGKIHFMAVPAEEYIEIGFRKGLREKGIIRYLGGKPELVYRGWFDDVDISMMVHSTTSEKKICFGSTSNGCLAKKIRYLGKSAHAGGSPEKGINALYAANLGIMAINSIRETFTEDEFVRVHPIITKGGDIVNVIPSEVCIETFVRGKTIENILNANRKVDRALVGGAVALGAKVEIEDIPGYMPLHQYGELSALFKQVALEYVDEEDIKSVNHSKGSTDMGDLSAIMPVVHPHVGGCKGGVHSADFSIEDFDTAYVLGAKLLAAMTVSLLYGDASTAGDIIKGYTPLFETKQHYLDFMDSMFSIKVYPTCDPLE